MMMKRPELNFLNMYQKGLVIEERYQRRLREGELHRPLEIRRSYYQERMQMIAEAIDEVDNEMYRDVLTLKVIENMNFYEIGRDLGISEESAKIAYYRASKKIIIPKEVREECQSR